MYDLADSGKERLARKVSPPTMQEIQGARGYDKEGLPWALDLPCEHKETTYI